MNINFATKPNADTDLYVVGVFEGETRKIAGPDAAAIKAILDGHPDFKGAAGELIVGILPGFKAGRLGLLGLGSAKGRTQLALECAGGKLMSALISLPVSDVFVDCTAARELKADDIAALGSGAFLRAYEFRTYQTKNKDQKLPDALIFSAGAPARNAYARMQKIGQAVHWARDLGNEPPNMLYPESFADQVVDRLRPLGIKVTVLNEEALAKKGFGAMLAVGKASDNPPRLVIMEYKGQKAKTGRPIALVGKGITFDTGGYSIKTNEGMLPMKYDMCGAAAVAGAMMALAALDAPVHVVGVLALAENMISDEGYKPSDILKTLSGQTVEVTNTDAEGRLVLCDAMWYVQDAYKPRTLVDIATLTGAALVALGEEYAGLFTPDERLRAGLEKASTASGDKIWRMPLDKAFDKAMDSNVADMKNAASTRYGGSSTAAAFLQRFVQEDVAWAHIDMAPTMTAGPDNALCPKGGAAGFGVRLLTYWAMSAS
jgi:leucyl aminopeptidase